MTTNHPFASEQEIASLIDHTLLKPEANEQDIAAICRQALEHRFASVCVNPCWVRLVSAELRHSDVKTCCVAGFPLGASCTLTKSLEVKTATDEGASEIDMVLNIGALRSGHKKLVADEIRTLAMLAHHSGGLLKVILETCLLSDEEKVFACQLAREEGADFVKTSTGFSTGGATESDIVLMRASVGAAMGVKASGGIRNLQALSSMVRAGANRIGTSAGVSIITEFTTGDATNSVVNGGRY